MTLLRYFMYLAGFVVAVYVVFVAVWLWWPT